MTALTGHDPRRAGLAPVEQPQLSVAVGFLCALHLCAEKGHADVADALLTAHADVGAVDGIGDQALHVAAAAGHAPFVAALLLARADANCVSRKGQSYKMNGLPSDRISRIFQIRIRSKFS